DIDFGTDREGRDRGNFSSGLNLAFTAQRSLSGKAEVRLDADFMRTRLFLREGELSEGDGKILARIDEGTGKLEFESVSARFGRNLWQWHGAFGPAPEEMHAKPVYRYEFVSDGSRIAPEDSPEPALSVLARIAGIADPAEGRITADEIGV